MDKLDIILKQIEQLNKTIRERDEELYNYIRERVDEIHKYIEKLEKSFDDKFSLFETKMTKVYFELNTIQQKLTEYDIFIQNLKMESIDANRRINKINKELLAAEKVIEKIKIFVESKKNIENKKSNRIWHYIIPTATALTVALVMFFLNGGGK